MKPKTLIALCLVFALSVGIIAGWSVAIYVNKPTTMQKMLGIHDHMRSAEVRYVWRQIYCGEGK